MSFWLILTLNVSHITARMLQDTTFGIPVALGQPECRILVFRWSSGPVDHAFPALFGHLLEAQASPLEACLQLFQAPSHQVEFE